MAQSCFSCVGFSFSRSQRTFPERLCDIEALGARRELYDMGLSGRCRRHTLANANAARDWRVQAAHAGRVYAEFGEIQVRTGSPRGTESDNLIS